MGIEMDLFVVVIVGVYFVKEVLCYCVLLFMLVRCCWIFLLNGCRCWLMM